MSLFRAIFAFEDGREVATLGFVFPECLRSAFALPSLPEAKKRGRKGELRIENGEWRIENGELSMCGSHFSTFNFQFSTFNFQLSTFNVIRFKLSTINFKTWQPII